LAEGFALRLVPMGVYVCVHLPRPSRNASFSSVDHSAAGWLQCAQHILESANLSSCKVAAERKHPDRDRLRASAALLWTVGTVNDRQ